MDIITLQAPAKINLGLDVLKRLPNGYHALRMIMQTLTLFDEVTIEKRGDYSDIVLDTLGNTIPGLCSSEDNIVYKAAALLKKEYQISDGIHITLRKRIPAAAGMAGGSTDCAATLRGINTLFGLNLSVDQLCAHGVKLGADVPYCILQGTALSEGIGEKLTPLPACPPYYIVLVKPDIDVSTKYVYEHLTLDETTSHPDIDGMASAIRDGNSLGILSRLGNVLETVTQTGYPIIAELKSFLLEHGAAGALMSGSGPTVFALFEEKEKAGQALDALQNTYPDYASFLVTPYNP